MELSANKRVLICAVLDELVKTQEKLEPSKKKAVEAAKAYLMGQRGEANRLCPTEGELIALNLQLSEDMKLT